jgi:hypothetical protein
MSRQMSPIFGSFVVCCVVHVFPAVMRRRPFPDYSSWKYRRGDKSLSRPGRKQVTATEDFDFHISYL